MAKWSISSARIDEDTPARLVIASPSSARPRIILLGLLLVIGVGGVLLGLVAGETGLIVGVGVLCLLLALVLLFAVSAILFVSAPRKDPVVLECLRVKRRSPSCADGTGSARASTIDESKSFRKPVSSGWSGTRNDRLQVTRWSS